MEFVIFHTENFSTWIQLEEEDMTVNYSRKDSENLALVIEWLMSVPFVNYGTINMFKKHVPVCGSNIIRCAYF